MHNPIPSAAFDSPRTVVIIPTYNEAGNVTAVIDRVQAAAPDVDILVVDDNSPDGTAPLVMHHRGYLADDTGRREGPGRVFLLSRTAKDGLGAAYRAGFTWALTRGYETVAQMDADLSHPPERIPALLHALEGADVAVGSRYVPGGAVTNWSLSRRLISRAGNLYVRLVLGLPVHDTTAGFKVFRRDALERIGGVESASNGYCFQVENTWRAVRLGLRVTEVPITFTDRTVGTSKMSGSIVAEALTRVLVWRWNELLHRTGPGLRHDDSGSDAPGTPVTHKVPKLSATSRPSVMRFRERLDRLLTREVLTFLAVGGTGYVVDVVAFNLLRSMHPFASLDPSVARTLAVTVAMCVTYAGNRSLTWGHHTSGNRRREVSLFVLFNIIGFGFSILTLALSHDVLGLTSRLADNISANVVGLALGTVFRYDTYKRFVFATPPGTIPSSAQQRTDLSAREVPVAS